MIILNFLLIIIVLIIIAIILGNRGDKYLNSKFLRNVNHADIFYNGVEYKVYYLCCRSCYLEALKEIEYINQLNKFDSIPKLISVYEKTTSPNKNVLCAKKYIVLERESLKLINNNTIKINYPSF